MYGYGYGYKRTPRRKRCAASPPLRRRRLGCRSLVGSSGTRWAVLRRISSSPTRSSRSALRLCALPVHNLPTTSPPHRTNVTCCCVCSPRAQVGTCVAVSVGVVSCDSKRARRLSPALSTCLVELLLTLATTRTCLLQVRRRRQSAPSLATPQNSRWPASLSE